MKWWKKLKSLLRRNKSNLQSENRNSHQDDLIEKEIYFPCNAFFRKIIEAVLEQKGISYRDMRLFVIDAEDGAYLRQEEEQYMLQQLYPGLNAYTLCTGRPECHRKEMDYLYEEMGLIVEVLEKKKKAMHLSKRPSRFLKKQRESTLSEVLKQGIFQPAMQTLLSAKLLSEMSFSNFMKVSALS